MASKLPWRKFYYKDFTVDTQVLSVEACGAWIRILAFMNRDDDPTGSETLPLDGWAKVIGADEEKTAVILTELGSKHVAQINDGCDMSHNVTKSHSDVTVMSRRLVREHKGRDSNRLRKQKQRRHINVTELSQVRAEEESESELDKRSPKKETRQLGSQADLRAVFDYHCKVIGQAQNNDGPRQWRAVPGVLSKIKTRLKTFSVAECQQASDALSRSEFHMGQNDRNTEYCHPRWLFHSDDRVDEWLNKRQAATEATPAPAPLPRHVETEEDRQAIRETRAANAEFDRQKAAGKPPDVLRGLAAGIGNMPEDI